MLHPVRRHGAILPILILIALLLLSAASLGRAAAPPVKNIILCIADGCASEQYTLARWFKGSPLAFDPLVVGAVRTHIADSVVADSAPAATAYASGLRTSDKIIGLAPRTQGLLPGLPDPGDGALRPAATLLEAARLLGKSTGLVATARVSHATPAAFGSHVSRRDKEEDIAGQLVSQGIDVILGGGRAQFLPVARGGTRRDGRNLLETLETAGYRTPSTAAELAEVKAGRVAGLFAKSHLKPALDRGRLAPEEPTLADMTTKALEVLSKNPKGFFLMVEGSQVDWACHTNDAAYLVGELLAFDRAVQAALDFAIRDGHTLLVVVSDHNTGGMSIGNRASDKTYSQMKPAALLGPIGGMKSTARALWDTLGAQVDAPGLRRAVAEWWGIDLAPQEAERILTLSRSFKKTPEYALCEVVSAGHTMVGWTTHGHAGGDVPLFAFGPGRPAGQLAAPELGLYLAGTMGADLRALDDRLFLRADQALPGALLKEEKTSRGWVLRVDSGGRSALLENGGNLLRIGDRSAALEGVTVRVEDTGRWYLPAQAVRLIMGGNG